MSLIHGRLERTRGYCAGGMVQGSTGAGLAQPLAIPAPAASLNCSQADREGLCLGTPELILTQMVSLSVSSPEPIVSGHYLHCPRQEST